MEIENNEESPKKDTGKKEEQISLDAKDNISNENGEKEEKEKNETIEEKGKKEEETKNKEDIIENEKDKNKKEIKEKEENKKDDKEDKEMKEKEKGQKDKKENDIKEKNTKETEEEKQKNSININITKSKTKSFINTNIKKEKSDIVKQKNEEEEVGTHSNKNLFYLGNLFRDVINKYDMENDKKEEPRQFLEKSKNHSRISKIFINQEFEEQTFNFSNFINVQLNEVKQNTLSFLDKAKNELDKRYSLYIEKINEYINENELKISKVFPCFETNENFMNYADDNIFKQIEYLLEIHENIFSALEDHINLLFTFLDQDNLIQQKNPFEHFLNTNSNEVLNCWFLSKINFDKLSLSNIPYSF
jgi:hypothetical protein